MLSSLFFPVVNQKEHFLMFFGKPFTQAQTSREAQIGQIGHLGYKSCMISKIALRDTNNFVKVEANWGLGRKERKLRPLLRSYFGYWV